MWIRQLEAESINNWNMLVARFIEQFRVHIARPKNVKSLTTIKQRPRETLRSFQERFDVAAASVDRHEPSMVLMAAVSGVLDSSEFKKSLHRDPTRNRGDFYLEEDRFLREEEATFEKKILDVNMLETGEPSDYGKGKEKAAVKNDRNTLPRRGPRYEK